MTPINRFNLNINNPMNMQTRMQKSKDPNINIHHDLRDTYSVSARFNEFNSFLNANGMSYNQYSYMKWEAKMASIEQQQLANKSAGNTIVNGFTSIVDNLKNIFGW